MRKLVPLLLSCGIGLMAGWGGAGFVKLKSPAAAGEKASSSEAVVVKSTRTPAPASRLDSVEACKALIEASKQDDGRHPLLRRFDRERALRRWIELDPQGALAEAEANPTADFASDLFRAWAELDSKAALDAMKRSSRTLMGEVARDFFVALMMHDPALAVAELKQPPWKDGKEDLLGWGFHGQVARAWMRSDPQAAIASLGPPGSLKSSDEGQYAILGEWAKIDFAAAWAHEAKEGDSAIDMQRNDYLLAAGLLAGSKEALAVLAGITARNSGADEDSKPYFADTARAMAEADPSAALAWAQSRPDDDPLAREVLARAASKLASSDPVKALELLAESKGAGASFEQESILRESFASLAAADPARALGMISTLDPAQRKAAMSGYLTRVFAVDEAGGIAQCRAWLADPEMKEACGDAFAVAFSWGHGAGARDPGPLLEALPELGDGVNGYVLCTWTKCDPEASAAWIAQRLAEGKPVKELEDKGVLAELSISEPEFTAQWLTQLADTKVQESAAKILAANWASFDPEAARQWAEALSEGPVRAAATAGLDQARKGKESSASDPFAP